MSNERASLSGAGDSHATRAPSPGSLEDQARRLMDCWGKGANVRQRVATVEGFGRGLAEAGLVGAEEFRAFLGTFSVEDRPQTVESLARALVRAGRLTRYQAAAIYQGKARALRIGPYSLLDKLGSGGMGMVFKARRVESGPEFALKLLPPSASKREYSVRRFRREAEIMAVLDHPNLVSAREIGEYQGVHYLIMDYVKGLDLQRLVSSKGPYRVAKAVDLILQAARGLAAAHERGIVHRDIKPANLMLDAQGVVRVLDLGLARITRAEGSGDGERDDDRSLTRSGTVMGTVDYLPPEQSTDSKRVDHRADIYSLACTLHYLLTGKPPFQGDSIAERMLSHHREPIPSLRDARPEVPDGLDALFQRMMAKSPTGRPDSIAEAIEALESTRDQLANRRALRTYDDGSRPQPTPASSLSVEGAEPLEDGRSADLMTFIREQLVTPEKPRNPLPIVARPRRASGRSPDWRGPVDLIVRGLVAAASLVVLVRFWPEIARPPAPEGAPVRRAKPAIDPPKRAPEPSSQPMPVVAPKPMAKPGATPEPGRTVIEIQLNFPTSPPTPPTPPKPAPTPPPPAPRRGPPPRRGRPPGPYPPPPPPPFGPRCGRAGSLDSGQAVAWTGEIPNHLAEGPDRVKQRDQRERRGEPSQVAPLGQRLARHSGQQQGREGHRPEPVDRPFDRRLIHAPHSGVRAGEVEPLDQKMAEAERLDMPDHRAVGRRDRHAIGAELVVDPRLPPAPFQFPGVSEQVRPLVRDVVSREVGRLPLDHWPHVGRVFAEERRPVHQALAAVLDHSPDRAPGFAAMRFDQRARPAFGDLAVVLQDRDQLPPRPLDAQVAERRNRQLRVDLDLDDLDRRRMLAELPPGLAADGLDDDDFHPRTLRLGVERRERRAEHRPAIHRRHDDRERGRGVQFANLSRHRRESFPGETIGPARSREAIGRAW
jgi:serine/threonine protein kinase